jgi:hypothetical protein
MQKRARWKRAVHAETELRGEWLLHAEEFGERYFVLMALINYGICAFRRRSADGQVARGTCEPTVK